jgi:hypothetical protein
MISSSPKTPMNGANPYHTSKQCNNPGIAQNTSMASIGIRPTALVDRRIEMVRQLA